MNTFPTEIIQQISKNYVDILINQKGTLENNYRKYIQEAAYISKYIQNFVRQIRYRHIVLGDGEILLHSLNFESRLSIYVFQEFVAWSRDNSIDYDISKYIRVLVYVQKIPTNFECILGLNESNPLCLDKLIISNKIEEMDQLLEFIKFSNACLHVIPDLDHWRKNNPLTFQVPLKSRLDLNKFQTERRYCTFKPYCQKCLDRISLYK